MLRARKSILVAAMAGYPAFESVSRRPYFLTISKRLSSNSVQSEFLNELDKEYISLRIKNLRHLLPVSSGNCVTSVTLDPSFDSLLLPPCPMLSMKSKKNDSLSKLYSSLGLIKQLNSMEEQSSV